MKKEEFLSLITNCAGLSTTCEIRSLLSLIYEKFRIHNTTGKTIYCNEFYTPNIWRAMESLSVKLNSNIFAFGVFKEAERKIIAFSFDEPSSYPISLLKIISKSKFQEINHKDYLGAIMSLGIKREKIGDIIKKEDFAFVAVHSELVEYIKSNLDSISNVKCIIQEVDIALQEIPEYIFQEFTEIISSLRLDCVVSAICNISRSKAENIIKEGKVLIDYRVEHKKDFSLLYNSTITIRGYGKFKLAEEIGKTKGDRLKILIKKFI